MKRKEYKKINKFNTYIEKIKKFINRNSIDILIPIISFLILIVSSFTIGIIKAIILFILINAVYFIPNILKRKKGSEIMAEKKKTNAKKITSKKSVSNKAKSKTKAKKGFKIFLIILLTCFILGIIAVIGFFSYIVVNAPEFSEEMLYVTEPTIVYDKDGNEFAKLGEEKRVTLSYDEIPEVLIDAIVATEDSRFFEHNGVDWARFLKASAYQLMGRSEAGGASTLTMQVSKNNISQDNTATGLKGIIRKFTDVYVSLFKIEKKYTKERIMEFYVNTYWLGSNSYGVEQISLTYFGKSAKDLNLSEAAMIAGLFQAPGKYNPYTNPEATEARRKTVLKLMKRHGYINEKEYKIASELTVDKIVIPKEESAIVSGTVSKYQPFIDTVVEEVEELTGNNPYTTSMEIYTTLDPKVQDYLNKIMSGESYNWENDTVQAGVAIINVKDGSITAIGGNRQNDAIDKYNYATDLNNQIGSTAKPLYDYGPAIEYNNWNTYSILVDEPITYSDGHSINNWDGGYEGFETMRIALKGSRNIPALKTFKAVNKSKIIEFVTNLGLTPEIYSCDKGYYRDGKICINKEDPDDVKDANVSDTLHEAHAIGGYNGESPLTLTAAYAAFPNKGVYTKPYSFTKLIYRETNKEYENTISKTEVMSEATAYMVSDMLATTAYQAMGRSYNINGVKYAAKTGTTNYDEKKLQAHGLLWSGAVNDLWAVGYNTEYAVGVWYGYDKLSSKHYNRFNTGEHTRLLQAVAKKVFTNKDYFKRPSNVIEVELEKECPEATLPSKYTPNDLRITELFIAGTEPTEVSKRFDKLEDVSNLTATDLDGVVTLKWDAVANPKINDKDYLKQYYDKVFEKDNYLNNFVSARLNYNKNKMGVLGYNVYLKDAEGNLNLLDFVTTNEYQTNLDISGEYTFVVKTSYSIFKANMSDGKSIKLNITVTSPIIPPTTTPDSTTPTTPSTGDQIN